MSSKVAGAYLLKACLEQKIELAEKALKNDADPNFTDKFGMTPLMVAAQNSDQAMVQLLMRSGADLRCFSQDGMYPMAVASMLNRPDLIDSLGHFCWDLYKPYIDAKEPLEFALMAYRMDAAWHLVRHGADIHIQDQNSISFLMRIAALGDTRLLDFLEKNGANWFHQDNKDLNAFDYARRLKQVHIIEDLKKIARNQPLINVSTGKVQPLSNRLEITNQEMEDLATTSISFGNTSPNDPIIDFNSNSLKAIKKVNNQWRIFMLKDKLRLAKQNLIEWNYWNKKENKSTLKNTREFIGLLESGNLHKARNILDFQKILPNARNQNGTPLLILICQALYKPDASSNIDRSGYGDMPRCDIAERIIELLVKDGVNQFASCPKTGDGIAHAFMQGPHVRTYFKLLDKNVLDSSTINRSNKQLDRPLHIACRRNDQVATQGLLRRGADRNPVNLDGHTPLHFCAIHCNVDMASILISEGANTVLKTRRGQTLDRIVSSFSDRAQNFSALLQASQSINQARSIFSTANPMAQYLRKKQNGYPGSIQ